MDRDKVQFFVGLIFVLGSGAWTFFWSFHPSQTIILVLGLWAIATSKYRLLR